MTSTIGVYETQEAAVQAINALKEAGYSAKNLSIIGQAPNNLESQDKLEYLDSDHEMDKPFKIAATSVGIGAVVGPILGALAGVGILAIPGVGFLVGAGALAGAVAGLDVGLIGGGIVSALAIARSNKTHEDNYNKHIYEGKFLVVAQGTEEQVHHAHEVLDELGIHHELEKHL